MNNDNLTKIKNSDLKFRPNTWRINRDHMIMMLAAIHDIKGWDKAHDIAKGIKNEKLMHEINHELGFEAIRGGANHNWCFWLTSKFFTSIKKIKEIIK